MSEVKVTKSDVAGLFVIEVDGQISSDTLENIARYVGINANNIQALTAQTQHQMSELAKHQAMLNAMLTFVAGEGGE
jgi:hypothetical protein